VVGGLPAPVPVGGGGAPRRASCAPPFGSLFACGEFGAAGGAKSNSNSNSDGNGNGNCNCNGNCNGKIEMDCGFRRNDGLGATGA
jgi:hypothetical protein